MNYDILTSENLAKISPGHGVNMTGAGTPPLCFCGWQQKGRTGPILADHLAEEIHGKLINRTGIAG